MLDANDAYILHVRGIEAIFFPLISADVKSLEPQRGERGGRGGHPAIFQNQYKLCVNTYLMQEAPSEIVSMISSDSTCLTFGLDLPWNMATISEDVDLTIRLPDDVLQLIFSFIPSETRYNLGQLTVSSTSCNTTANDRTI